MTLLQFKNLCKVCGCQDLPDGIIVIKIYPNNVFLQPTMAVWRTTQQLSSAVWYELGPRFESRLRHVCIWYRSSYYWFNIISESRVHPRSTKQGRTYVWNTSPLTWSQYRKQFRRKADEKKWISSEMFIVELVLSNCAQTIQNFVCIKWSSLFTWFQSKVRRRNTLRQNHLQLQSSLIHPVGADSMKWLLQKIKTLQARFQTKQLFTRASWPRWQHAWIEI